MSRHTKHMAIDGQVFFHRQLFVNPVKPWRCTTDPVEPVNGTNKYKNENKTHPFTPQMFSL